MKSAEIVVPKPTSYKLPEGRFKAKIARVVVKPAKGSREGKDTAYVHLDVTVKGMERFECCARAILPFDLEYGSPLRRFAEDLLGKSFFEERGGQSIDLNAVLRDKECEIDLLHGKHDDNYDWPMVLVANVYPVTSTPEIKPATKLVEGGAAK